MILRWWLGSWKQHVTLDSAEMLHWLVVDTIAWDYRGKNLFESWNSEYIIPESPEEWKSTLWATTCDEPICECKGVEVTPLKKWSIPGSSSQLTKFTTQLTLTSVWARVTTTIVKAWLLVLCILLRLCGGCLKRISWFGYHRKLRLKHIDFKNS